MSSTGGVFSQTLQEITNTKLQELSKKRASFERSKAAVIADADAEDDPIAMLTVLSEGTQACFGIRKSPDGNIISDNSRSLKLETDLRNLKRFIDQAKFDPSISPKVIRNWKESLVHYLDVQSLKYQYADLYGKLTVEWLASSQAKGAGKKPSGSEQFHSDGGDDFEEVSVKAKIEARQKWEREVFEPVAVNSNTIKAFLNKLFEDEEAQKAVNTLRQGIIQLESHLAASSQFNAHTLTWTIKGLLSSGLLTNEKRDVLRDFLSNQTILTELADVLNMRMAALDTWTWGSEVTVEARRQLNGKFNIYMHEDLLQAIFLQYIGSKWSSGIKEHLMKFVWNKELWNLDRKSYSAADRQRRKWYLPPESSTNNLDRLRALHYRGAYFVSQLLDRAEQDLTVQEGDEEADFTEVVQDRRAMSVQVMSAYAPMAAKKKRRSAHTGDGAAARAEVDEIELDLDEEDDEDMGFGLFDDESSQRPDLASYKTSNPMDAKQKLLHLLSAEIFVKTRVNGEITAFRSQFDSWYQSLPHVTISTVLAYFGVSPKWLDFFTRFLEAPLRFVDEEGPVRLRKRGSPDAHILTDFFGESILFCLDFAVNKQTGSDVLWRLKDDIWFWSSSHETCVDVWKLNNRFNQIMGLKLDDTRSAGLRLKRKEGKLVPAKLDKALPNSQIRWGMLYLDAETGRFTIDKTMVDKHIKELRRQLKDKESSIFAWIQAYSTYVSVFFTTNFGKPANCFGREHVDAMLRMHERVQRTLFQASADGSITSVVEWLKTQIEQRFGVKDIPDGYLFFPTVLGGLDVKSPFINLLQLRESVTANPEALLDTFENDELAAYLEHKKKYLARQQWLYPTKAGLQQPENPEEFMPFYEYIKFREQVHYGFENELVDVYAKLLERPEVEPLDIYGNTEMMEALRACQTTSTGPQSITEWYSMDPYWKWVTMLYGPEILQRFGGFDIVDSGLLPMGMVSMFKSGRVSWQE